MLVEFENRCLQDPDRPKLHARLPILPVPSSKGCLLLLAGALGCLALVVPPVVIHAAAS